MYKQTIADKLEKSILDRVCRLLVLLSDYIIESGCTGLEVNKSIGAPRILFRDNSNTEQFCIELVKED